jgi:hypothetical protein
MYQITRLGMNTQTSSVSKSKEEKRWVKCSWQEQGYFQAS